LQLQYVLIGLQLRIIFDEQKNFYQRFGKGAFRFCGFLDSGGGHCFAARLDDFLQGIVLVLHIALDGFHEIRNQIVAALELDVDLFPGVL
jgi:hypothetical protein